MSPLTRTNEWSELRRPLFCRHCWGPLSYGTFAVVDLENPWLSFHESCLQDLGVDRSVLLYDEIAQLMRSYVDFARPGSDVPLPVSKTNEVERRLKELELEIANLHEMYEKKLVELPGYMRPGVRHE